MIRPTPYRGNQDYIFISYAHKDSALVWPIVDRMQRDGFRVWYDEGIDPGTEWDENIAAHVNGCGFFIAFLSKNYLASDNCKDELNFARDQGKQRILIYLEDVELPQGMAMRLGRSQAIYYDRYDDKTGFFNKLYEAQGIAAFGVGAAAPSDLPPQPPASGTVTVVRSKKKMPPWILPAALVALLAVVAAVVIGLGGGEKTLGDASAPPVQGDTSTLPGEADGVGTVLVDSDELQITVVGVKDGDDRYYGLELSIQNKTDREIYLSLDKCYINSAAVNDGWSARLEPGLTITEVVELKWSALEVYHITEVTVIQAILRGYFTDDYADLNPVQFTFYPKGEENASTAPWEMDEDDVTLVENEDFALVLDRCYVDEATGDWIMDVFAINRTDRTVSFSLEDGVINGYVCDPYWMIYVEPMTLHWDQIEWEDWRQQGMDSVVAMEGRLNILDSEHYDTWLDETFTYYPQGEEAAVLVQRLLEPDDVVLLDNDILQLVYTGLTKDGSDYYYLNFYYRNKTEEDLFITWKQMTFNGVEDYDLYIPRLLGGTQFVQKVNWHSEDGQPLEEIAFELEIADRYIEVIGLEPITVSVEE